VKVDGLTLSGSEVTVHAGRSGRFESRLRIKDDYWNQIPSGLLIGMIRWQIE
jgi:hypothetical protein